MYCSQKLGEDFAKFCGLLRIYELYNYLIWFDSIFIDELMNDFFLFQVSSIDFFVELGRAVWIF